MVQQVLVVAGEASGDQHAAELVAALQKRAPELRFFGMGGPKLAARGVELLYGAHEISVMGFTEVLPKLWRILRVMKGLATAAGQRKPSCAILVDVPDFNLRLAGRLKRLGIPVAYYVSPTVWAWRRGRVHTIARVVDRMLCILPFEEPFYAKTRVSARYVGSPVLEQVPEPGPPEKFRTALGLDPARPTLALLPGSRASELRRLLPVMAEASRSLVAERPELQLVLPVAPGVSREEIAAAFPAPGPAPVLIDGRAPEVVGASDVAIVASGTAVLEAGLMLRPMVVVYRVSALSWLIGRLLVRVAHVALVNLLAGRRLVPELLQSALTPSSVVSEVKRLWSGPARDEVLEGLTQVRQSLGPKGAAERAAEEVLSLVRGQ